MKKIIMLVAVLLGMISLQVFAEKRGAFKQKAEVILNVSGFDGSPSRKARGDIHLYFQSSDIGNVPYGTASPGPTNGTFRAEHTYSHGPKNYYLNFRPNVHTMPYKMVVRIDSSCRFLHFKKYNDVYISNAQRTGRQHERWKFSAKYQAESQILTLSCSHSAWN